MNIDTFLENYGDREAGFNDEICYEDGTFNVNNFISTVY